MSAQLAKLVLRAKGGDAEAFGDLYVMYEKEMILYANSIVGDQFLAQDAVSDAVLEAFKQIKNLRNPDSFKGWLFKILNASCKSQYNKMTETLPLVTDEKSTTGGGLENIDLSIDLQRAMKVLSEEERSIVMLKVLNGYKAHEIGEILDLPGSTVRSKLKRALKKLRDAMDPNNEEGGENDENE